MRRFVLGQIVVTLAIAAIFLGTFAVFDGWNKPLEARTAAMAIAFFAVYPAIILFRLLVKAGDWDGPVDVAFAAAVCATIALMGLGGSALRNGRHFDLEHRGGDESLEEFAGE